MPRVGVTRTGIAPMDTSFVVAHQRTVGLKRLRNEAEIRNRFSQAEVSPRVWRQSSGFGGPRGHFFLDTIVLIEDDPVNGLKSDEDLS